MEDSRGTSETRIDTGSEAVPEELMNEKLDRWLEQQTAESGSDPPDLEVDGKGKVKPTAQNIIEILEHDPVIAGSVNFNVLAYSPWIRGKVPWEDDLVDREWTNFDDSCLFTFLQKKYGISNRPNIADGLNVVLKENQWNPVVDRLSEIYAGWNHQTGYIENLLPDYLGVEKNVYSIECMKLLMVGAISRVFRPGCKFDFMVVLVGPQGIGKSTFFRYLALDPTWYNDNFNTIDGDKASEKLRGVWFAEMAELLATKRAKDVEGIKSFITSQVDAYRPPYERRTEHRPRMAVFVGTTNNEKFLTDRTGNRRFLPLICRPEYARKSLFDDPDLIKSDFVNAWGEAMDLFFHDPESSRLILSPEAAEYARQQQDEFVEEDPRVGLIQEWLDSHPEVTRVCACMLYREALGFENMNPKKSETNDIIAIMSNEIKGWKRIPGLKYCRGYGTVTCFERDRETGEDFREKEEDFMHVPDSEKLPFD